MLDFIGVGKVAMIYTVITVFTHIVPTLSFLKKKKGKTIPNVRSYICYNGPEK